MKIRLSLFAFALSSLTLPSAAEAVAPASPASCKSVIHSKLGEHLRETVWDLTRARAKLNRTLRAHNKLCMEVRGDLSETRQLSNIEKLGSEARRNNAELLDLEDEYLHAAQTASEAAHLLQENECEQRIQDQRRKLDAEMTATEKEVADVLGRYCR